MSTKRQLPVLVVLSLILFGSSDKALHGNEKVQSREQRAKTGFGQKRRFMRILFPTACVNQGLQTAMILLSASKPWSRSSLCSTLQEQLPVHSFFRLQFLCKYLQLNVTRKLTEDTIICHIIFCQLPEQRCSSPVVHLPSFSVWDWTTVFTVNSFSELLHFLEK